MKIIPYSLDKKDLWDEFVEQYSLNGTIFHEQQFLSYHKDRFHDASIMIYEGQKLIGVFPAVFDHENIISHSGSTYGGLVVHKNIKLKNLYDMVGGVVEYYRRSYKNVVKQIRMVLSEEFPVRDMKGGLAFSLFQHGFQLTSKEISTVISIDGFLEFNGMRKTTRQYLKSKKYEKLGVVYERVERSSDILDAYALISQNMEIKYAKKPTHSKDEFLALLKMYPDRISVFVAKSEGVVIATYVVFALNNDVAHVFYIARDVDRLNVADIGLVNFIVSYYKEKNFSFINFGISSRGREIKWWIHNYKEQFSKNFLTRDVWMIDISEG